MTGTVTNQGHDLRRPRDGLERLKTLIAATAAPLSEYSVANLVLFDARHDYVFCEEPIPHVRGVTYDGERHALPLAPLDAAVCTALLDQVDCIAPLGEAAPGLARAFGLACDWNKADSDYLYDARCMAVLAGAKAKRSQARAFERDCSPQLLSLTHDTQALAEEVLNGWQADVGRDEEVTDYRECREALRLRAALALEGRIVSVAGIPVAFMLSGPAADGGRIMHFAKGRRAFSAAYPWMLARYAAEIGTGTINFEQDLGRPGFAQAKRAFAPIALLHKYRIRKP